MAATLHKLTAGDGYLYLIRQVAASDSTERGRNTLSEYYSAKGEAPGRWVGTGLASLSDTGARDVSDTALQEIWSVPEGSEVHEEQMAALFGEGLHPNAVDITNYTLSRGAQPAVAIEAAHLGRRFAVRTGETEFQRALEVAYREHNARLHQKWNTPIDDDVRAQSRTTLARQRFADEYGREPADDRELSGFIARNTRARTTAVAGYDVTFSPVKSVSALWAVAPLDVAREIEECHDDAVADALAFMESPCGLHPIRCRRCGSSRHHRPDRHRIHPPRLPGRRPRPAHPRRGLQQGRHHRCQRRAALAGPGRAAPSPGHGQRLRAVQHAPGSTPWPAPRTAVHRDAEFTGTLRSHRSIDGGPRRGERGAHPVAGVLEHEAAVGLDRGAQQRIMGGQRRPHAIGVGLPPTRRPLDVGEQKRHHPRRRSRRHGIASAHFICPSKPRDFAIAR